MSKVGRSLVFVVGLVAALAVLSMHRPDAVLAAPLGAAQNQLVSQQSCGANGMVNVQLTWTPSGWGNQYADVTTSPTFAGWTNAGPIDGRLGSVAWTNLRPNTLYYSRVSTWGGIEFIKSDTYAFNTIACSSSPAATGSFSSLPSDLQDTTLSATSVRLSWLAGLNNNWYCVDIARTEAELLGMYGSWSNHGCGSSATVLDVGGLACGTKYYWRVYASGPGGSGHSKSESVETSDCVFSPPSNPRAELDKSGVVEFDWDRGSDNLSFCIDIAASPNDLLTFSGSFRNVICGLEDSEIDLGIGCGAVVYWRVYAVGSYAGGHSPIATASTSVCGFSPPYNLDTDDVERSSAQVDWDRGNENLSFCVDTAASLADLTSFTGSWMSRGCGVHTQMDLYGLSCGTAYYWRVYAEGSMASGHSTPSQFFTKPCVS